MLNNKILYNNNYYLAILSIFSFQNFVLNNIIK